jgi:hypothetical protein
MDLVIVFLLLFVFLGLCIAAVVFAIKRDGWKPTLRYLFFAILIRVLMHFSTQHIGEGGQIIIPLLGAGLIAWLWPHIVKQRMRENDEGSL